MFDTVSMMEFLDINESGDTASLCSLGKGRKVLLWRIVDNPKIAKALKSIPRHKEIRVAISGRELTGIELPNGEIVGDMLGK